MRATDRAERAYVSTADPVAERQPAAIAEAPRHGTDNRDLREQIKVLESRALTLVHSAVMNSGTTAAAHRSLAAVDAEITSLRAELAWQRTEARAAVRPRPLSAREPRQGAAVPEAVRPVSDRDGLVSVIIATYNMGGYLTQAVESVLAQSYPELELLIVDDGSTDDTPDIVRQWQSDPRVRVLRQPNAGQARAKNAGVRLSRGAFVAFLDADDVWLPDKLASQMPLFEGRPDVGVVYSEYEKMDGAGRPLPRAPSPLHRGRVSGALLIENFVGFPTAVVRRALLERYGAFDENLGMGIDYELWLRLSAHCEFDFVARATARYRVWGGQMSGNYRERYRCGIRIMQNFLAKHRDTVDPAVVRSAWAHTYTGRGDVTLWRGRDRRGALRDYARALSYQPWYWPAWRALLRSIVTARAPA